MKLSMAAAVGLLLMSWAFWIGQAEAQHRAGGAKAGGAHAPKAAARPGGAHKTQPKAKAHQKAKAAAKKHKQKESAKAKHDTKKKHEHKKEDKKEHKKEIAKAKTKPRERAKKAQKKAGRTVAAGGIPRFSDQETISLLRAAHHKLQMVNHDYGVHRRRASEHVGSALRHLGSSAQAQAPAGTGNGRANSPQSVSDAVMLETRTSLEEIRNRLAAGTGASHGHAHNAVNAAIGEIDLALSVR